MNIAFAGVERSGTMARKKRNDAREAEIVNAALPPRSQDYEV